MTKKLSTPFAVNSTLRNDVPINATNDQTNKGIVGYNNGWTAINKLPLENGGQPPYMEDLNGVLFDITGNIVDINKGLPQYYDDAYSTLTGGYPIGSRLCLNDNSDYVVSTIANNTNNPNTNMTGWIRSKYFNSVAEMTSFSGSGIAVTKSYYSGLGKGGAVYYYDSTQSSTNNGVTIINGWVLQLQGESINCFVAGFKADGTDETSLAKTCFNTLGMQVEIPSGVTIAVSADIGLESTWACGLGQIEWLNFDKTTDMERVANSNVYPTPFKHNTTYQQIQFTKAKGALGGKNVGQRFECNAESLNSYTFNDMKTLINYGGADVVGSMLKVTDAVATTYSNCTYTATTVQCDGFKNNTIISAGDYIRAGDDILGVVYSIDTTTGTITLVDGWGNTTSKELNVTPTNDMSCITPIAYRLWARNDYVTARANNSTIYNIIGYEMDVIAGHNLTDSVGFLGVAFGTDTCVSAFRSDRGTATWWYGYHVAKNSAKTGLYVEAGAAFAVQHGANYTEGSTTVYSSQAYTGVKVTYAKNVGLDVDNTPTAVNATNVSVGLDVGGASDTGLQFNGTNGNAKAVATQTNSGYLIHSNIAGLGTYTVSSIGQENRTRKVVTNVTSDTTLSRDNSTNMIIVSGSTATISFSLAFADGEIVEIKSTKNSDVVIKDQGGSTIATLNSTAKSYGRFLFTNGNWFNLFSL